MTGAVSSVRAQAVAALPMYDLPHLQVHNNLLWRAIGQRLEESGVSRVPQKLMRDLPLPQLWRHSDLLLAQTCGYPLVRDLRGLVQLVATPKYDVPGCRDACHRSFIVVRADERATNLADLRGRHCAVNELDSNSGMNLLRAVVAPLAHNGSFFDAVTVSGSHWQSLNMIVEGDADVAAIDCVTYAHVERSQPELIKSTRILDWTNEAPCLPFITAAATDARTFSLIQEALQSVANDPNLASTRAKLFLTGFEFLPWQRYEQIAEIEQNAIRLGYPRLD